MKITLSRRQWLRLLGGAAGAVVLGCGDDTDVTVQDVAVSPDGVAPDGATDAAPSPALDGFAALERLRELIRKSPDHLAAEADRVVATRDPQAILDFVSRRIGHVLAFGEDPVTSTRWGVRSVLRGGAGTPREKAELLRQLYERAGLSVTMMKGTLLEQHFGYRYEEAATDTFTFDVDPAELEGLRRVLRVPDALSLAQKPEWSSADVDDLLGRVRSALPELTAADLPGLANGPGVSVYPVLQVVTADGSKFANPFVEGAVLGQSYTEAAPEPAPELTPAPTVSGRLEALVSTDNPFDPKRTLVEGTWTLDQLIGRQLVFGLVAAAPLPLMMSTPISAITAFTPVFSVLGPDVSAQDRASLTKMDQVVLRDGQALMVKDGVVRVAGRALPAVAPSEAVLAAVSTLEVEVDASAFPSIRGRIRALDDQGKALRGVAGSAYGVQEDALALPALVYGASDAPPRIALVFDRSSSVPLMFVEGEQTTALTKQLVEAVHAVQPGAQVLIGSVADGGVEWWGDWTADGDAAADSAGKLRTDSSDLWAALATAAEVGADVVAVITDGVPLDQSTTARLEIIRRGPPVVFVDAGTGDRPFFDQILTAASGVVVPATDRDAAVAAIAGFVGSPKAGAASFQYEAPSSGGATRTVRVTLGSREGTTTYGVPEVKETPAARLAGLQLVLQIGERVVTRPLSGWFRHGEGVPTTADIAETQAALFALHQLSFEGAPPTLAVQLDDLLTAKLASRALALADTLDKLEAGLSELRSRHTSRELSLHRWMGAPDGRTLPDLCTAVRQSLYPVFDAKDPLKFQVAHVTDMLDFARFVRPGEDRAAVFGDVLRRTIELGLVEAGFGTDSALNALGGSLRRLDQLPVEELFPGLDAARLARWRRTLELYPTHIRVGPTSGDRVAFLAVEPTTGTLLVVGEGGGGELIEHHCGSFRDTAAVLSYLSMAAGIAELFGYSLGAIGPAIAIAKAMVAIIYICTLRINNMDVPPGLVRDMQCDAAVAVLGVVKEAVGGRVLAGLTIAANAWSAANDAYTAASGGDTSPLACSSRAGLDSGPC